MNARTHNKCPRCAHPDLIQAHLNFREKRNFDIRYFKYKQVYQIYLCIESARNFILHHPKKNWSPVLKHPW